MKKIKPETAERISMDASTAVGDAMMQWIDNYSAKTGADRRQLAAIVGKALILEGTSLIGNSMQLKSEPSLQIAENALEAFQNLARERIAGLHHPDDWNN
jgi:hypothetical protein